MSEHSRNNSAKGSRGNAGKRPFRKGRDTDPRRDASAGKRRRYDEQRGREGRGRSESAATLSSRPQRSQRGGRNRQLTEAERLQQTLRPIRSEHQDPALPEEVTAKDLHPAARNELKTLQADTAELVARHLAMVAALLADDPALAHQHAISASRRAGRIPVARETLAITAYHTGDYALALRELRTYRRLTGSQGHVALMVECERALGRPERGIETGLAAQQNSLTTEQRVHLAIAMSGARLDLGQTQQALYELEIAELDPHRAFDWSPELFAAYAAVLEDLGREKESKQWRKRALLAEAALNERLAAHDRIQVFDLYEHAAGEED